MCSMASATRVSLKWCQAKGAERRPGASSQRQAESGRDIQPGDVTDREKMVALVERMLDLHNRLHVATIPADNKLYQRQIEATDHEIDALVYELYGLTEQEIAIVEEEAR